MLKTSNKCANWNKIKHFLKTSFFSKMTKKSHCLKAILFGMDMSGSSFIEKTNIFFCMIQLFKLLYHQDLLHYYYNAKNVPNAMDFFIW